MHGIFFKTVITLISVVLYLFSLVPQLRLRQDYDCVHSDLFLYSFAIFFCQSKVAHVKMNAPSLVSAKKKPKQFLKHSELYNLLLIYSLEMCRKVSPSIHA